MSTIQVRGLKPLKGEIEIQGSKNAVLPMMAAALLHKGTTVLTNVPGIQDVFCMMGILEYMGCRCSMSGHRLTIDAATLTGIRIPEVYVKAMRSSIMLLGALLGRTGEAVTHYPGGCSIGKRPIDLHLYALGKLGASIKEEEEVITASASALKGTTIVLSYPSVGATENALLAAVLAQGETEIRNSAREPEIEELCYFLNGMGGDISGIGTSTLHIKGVKKLHDSSWHVVGDRIVAGTYLAAASIAGGDIRLWGVRPEHMSSVLPEFEKLGNRIEQTADSLRICAGARPCPIHLETGPYPGFPTDLQSPMMALLSTACGDSSLRENVFEGRYETVKELQKLGAEIIIKENTAFLRGCYPLKGADVAARDLRGGAALIVAGLAAEGETVVSGCHHIMRGYEDICRDLQKVGAEIRQTK